MASAGRQGLPELETQLNVESVRTLRPRASGPAGVQRWHAPGELGNGTRQSGQAAMPRRAGPPALRHQEQAYAQN